MLRILLLTFMSSLLLFPNCSSMSISKRGQVQICGKRLAQTLNLLCRGQYYDPEEGENKIRRHIRPLPLGDDNRKWYLGVSSRWIDYMGKRHFLQPTDRRERGVVDECCRQPCSTSVLKSYCSAHK